MRIILASQSPRRKELLNLMNVKYEVIVSNVDEKLEKGITIEDFSEYEGLFQTLNPAFYEIALNKSLENLGLEMIDVYYIHIPEITKLKLTEDEFYEKMEMLIRWYETKCFEGKIRYYGIAFEFMVEEPFENK